jgi:hypothetical protein
MVLSGGKIKNGSFSLLFCNKGAFYTYIGKYGLKSKEQGIGGFVAAIPSN